MIIKLGRFVLDAVEVDSTGVFVAEIPDSCWDLRLTRFGFGEWGAELVNRVADAEFMETHAFEPSAQAAADAFDSLIRSLAGAVL